MMKPSGISTLPIDRAGQYAPSSSGLPCGKTAPDPVSRRHVELRVEDQVVGDVDGDVVEHQRGDDLVGVEPRLEHADDPRPQRSGGGAGDDHQRDHRLAELVAQREAEPAPGDRTHHELSLAADVEQAHPERDRRRQTGEQQRRGGDDRGRQRFRGAEGAVDDPAVGVPHVVAADEDQHRAGDQGGDDRSERHGPPEPTRRRQPAFEADHSPPPISIPMRVTSSCSSVVSTAATSTSPTMRPS